MSVGLIYDVTGVRLVVTDTGGRTGEPLTQQEGHGLLGMRERVAAVGGRLVVGPDQGGFRVDAFIPDAAEPKKRNLT